MLKRISAITGIFVASWIAWGILTFVIWARTGEKSESMASAVGELWGTEHRQVAPQIKADWTTITREEVEWTHDGWQPPEEESALPPAGADDTSGLLGSVTSTYEAEKIVSRDIEEPEGAGRKERKSDGMIVVLDWKTDPRKKHERVRESRLSAPLMLEGTDAQVDLDVDYRKKGLLWFSTFGVLFRSTYRVRNPTGHEMDVTMRFAFPSASAIYDNMKVTVKGRKDARVTAEAGSMVARFTMAPATTEEVTFGYHSRGMDRWYYSFGPDVKMVRDFRLAMRTDFERIDFPRGSISPDTKEQLDDRSGWELVWDKESVVSGMNIGMIMPRRINPGPLAQSMTAHAPVSLFFFFFVMFVLQVLRGIRMHPMNYFFIAASFFAFNLLFSYLVDHIDVLLAFAISSAVSIALVVSYLRVVVGLRFALVEAGACQLIYQALFGLAHFLKGYTGLTITVGAIVTLAIVMQLTARTDWEKVFRPRPRRDMEAAGAAP